MEVLIAAAVTAAVTLIKSIIEIAATAGFDEARCEDAKTKALAAIGDIDARLIAQEAREQRIARGEPA